MQIEYKNWNPDLHDCFSALTVKQPYASDLLTFDRHEKGFDYALKSIEVRTKKIHYRGQILITSSAYPVIYGLESGVILGFVDLYDCRMVNTFTKEDWENTRIPTDKRKFYQNGFGWFMRSPERVIELPVKGQVGLWNAVFEKGEIIKYPKVISLDKKGFNILNSKE